MQKQKEIGPFDRGDTEKSEDPQQRGQCDAEMWHHIPVPVQEPAAAQLPSPALLPRGFTLLAFLFFYGHLQFISQSVLGNL